MTTNVSEQFHAVGEDIHDTKAPSGPIERRWDERKFSTKLVNPANRRKLSVIVVGDDAGVGPRGQQHVARLQLLAEGGQLDLHDGRVGQGRLGARVSGAGELPIVDGDRPRHEPGDVDRPVERERDAVARVFGFQPFRGVIGDDRAVVDHHHTFRELVGLVQVVGGEHDRSVVPGTQFTDVFMQVGPVLRV